MPTNFLHGVEVLQIDTGARPIQTVRSSVIGLIGTAPDADAVKFPINTPVLVTSKSDYATLGTTGTLKQSLDLIYAQAGAVVVVIRVTAGANDEATITNVVGGTNAGTGAYEGVYDFLAAENAVGFQPKVLIAPGFTHQRHANGILSIPVTTQGSGYLTAPAVTISAPATDGVQATAVAVLGTGANAGKVVSFTITNPGTNYTGAVTVTIGAPPSGGVQAVAGTATKGTVRNRVVSELLSIADRLRAVIIADGPNTTDAAAIQTADDFGSRRVYMVDPWVVVGGVTQPASPAVAGIINRTDNELGFWWSPSNKEVYGIEATARAIDFALGDTNSRANLLNEQNVATIIREGGFRLWGNRTLSTDPLYAFLSVQRTADMINESILRGHLWAVDRCITATYLEEVMESVRGYLRTLKARGAILGGDVWVDPEQNTPTSIANGQVVFDFEFTPPYPAERVTFRSHLVNTYVVDLFAALPAA
jgi:phage tail sheath protein FI